MAGCHLRNKGTKLETLNPAVLLHFRSSFKQKLRTNRDDLLLCARSRHPKGKILVVAEFKKVLTLYLGSVLSEDAVLAN
jgi:hypothetical protein